MPFRAPRRHRFSLGTAGVATLEMAMIAPFLTLSLIMFVDVGKAYRQQAELVSAVSAGAEFAYLGAQAGTAPATILSELPSEVAAASNALITSSNVSISINNNPITAATTDAELASYWAERCCLSGGAGSAVSYSCAANATTCSDSASPGLYITIATSMAFSPYFSGDTQMTGKTLGGSITARVQ
jgi:Flp pilus assembly protein TadG